MLVQMGQVKIAQQGVLESQIGTCVSLCLFHRESGLGGMTHISRSRSNDQTPSGRLLRHEGYHYADAAIPKLLELLGEGSGRSTKSGFKLFIFGGLRSEGPLIETLHELGVRQLSPNVLRTHYGSKYGFKLCGHDVNQEVNRNVKFDLDGRKIVVTQSEIRLPGASLATPPSQSIKVFSL